VLAEEASAAGPAGCGASHRGFETEGQSAPLRRKWGRGGGSPARASRRWLRVLRDDASDIGKASISIVLNIISLFFTEGNDDVFDVNFVMGMIVFIQFFIDFMTHETIIKHAF
jgi:hypothetical protein